METSFYPVVTLENEEELELLTSYCDEHRIEFQFLDERQEKFPTQALLFIDKEDFELFLKEFEEE